jgi:hypothetical protein
MMTTDPSAPPVREAVAVFDDSETLFDAIDELESSGFDREDLSLLAGKNTVEEKLGHVFKRVEDLEDDPDAPRQAFISPESVGDAKGWAIGGLLYVGGVSAAGAVVASGGTLLAAALAASVVGGAGGLIGTVLAQWIQHDYSAYLQDQIDRGGLLLWVHLPARDHEQRALEILRRHSAHNVHVHEMQLPRAAAS